MANPVVQPKTLSSSELGLKDLLDLLKKDIMLTLNCHHIGTIQSFNPANQTAKVTLTYKKTILSLNTASGQYEPRFYDYPILMDCPVVCLGGSGGGANGAALTFPIAKGDECLVLFNDRAIDSWLGEGETNAPPTVNRFHSISDGIALVGIRSFPNVLLGYDNTRVVLRYGSAFISLNGANKIKMANNVTSLLIQFQALVTQLQQLVAQVENLNVETANDGSITTNLAAINSAFASIIGASGLGGLLE